MQHCSAGESEYLSVPERTGSTRNAHGRQAFYVAAGRLNYRKRGLPKLSGHQALHRSDLTPRVTLNLLRATGRWESPYRCKTSPCIDVVYLSPESADSQHLDHTPIMSSCAFRGRLRDQQIQPSRYCDTGASAATTSLTTSTSIPDHARLTGS